MQFLKYPIRTLSEIISEFGLALLLCSYYISGIVSYYFGSNAGLFASAFPVIFGGVVVLRFLTSRKKLVGRGGKILMLFIFILFFILFSSIKSFAPIESIFFATRYFYAAIFLGVVAWIIASDNNFNLMRFYLYFCFAVSLLTVYIMLWGEAHGSRLSVADRNPIYFSLLCALSFSAAFFCLISKVKFGSFVYFFIFIALIISFMGMILSGGRGAVLSVVVTLVFYSICFLWSFVISGKFKDKVNVKFLLFFILIAILGILYFLDSRAVSGVFLLFSGEVGASGSVRLNLLNQWVNLFEDSPFFGVGFSSDLAYPHNIILELIFRFGIPGWVASVILIYLTIKYVLIGFLSRNLEIRILSALILVSFIAGLFSFSIVMMSHLFIFIIFASIFMEQGHRLVDVRREGFTKGNLG